MEEEKKANQAPEEEFITEERLKKAEAFIEEEEGPSRRLMGKMGVFITVVAVLMSLIHLYAAVGIIMTQILRGIHVMFVLFLVFLVFPSLKRFRNRVLWYDYILSALGVAVIVYTFLDFEEFIYRSVTPTSWDLVFGALLIAPGAGSHPPDDQLDPPRRGGIFSRLCLCRPLAAAPLDPPGLWAGPHSRPHVHDPGGDLRRPHRCLLHLYHPLHHLRGLSGILRRREVLHRFLPLRPWGESPPGQDGP